MSRSLLTLVTGNNIRNPIVQMFHLNSNRHQFIWHTIKCYLRMRLILVIVNKFFFIDFHVPNVAYFSSDWNEISTRGTCKYYTGCEVIYNVIFMTM